MSFAMVSMAVGVIATDSLPVILSGTGTATVNNAGPSLTGTAINDGGAWVTNLDVDPIEYYFYVNVSDANTLDDIAQVTLEMWVNANQGADNPTYRYKFQYTETTPNDGSFAGTWSQLYPTTGTYFNNANCLTPVATTSNSGSYVFAMTLHKTAKAGTWNYNATTTDSTPVKATASTKTFNVYKHLDMTYDTGGGSQNFAWTASIGAQNIADTFDITVTSNAPYTFSAAYENRFYNATSGTTWSNEPSLDIKYGTGLVYSVTNVTASYTQWCSFLSPVLSQTTSHTLYLDFESVLPALVYTGVIIYIQATV